MRFYLDTSIWLDFLENRNEPNFPKGEWAKKLIQYISEESHEIVYSDLTTMELQNSGYSIYEIEDLFNNLGCVIILVEATKKQVRKGSDLGIKRDVPKKDAVHALIARDNKATLVALDNHFKKLKDISISHSPKEFI